MAHPSWKGPREQVQLKLPKPDKDLLAARAQLAGLSYSEYVLALLHKEPVDTAGHPRWIDTSERHDPGKLPLAM